MANEPHILVVDDDPEIRNLLTRYLGGQGFRASSAADRKTCDARLEDSRPDLIVLDVMLPDGSGLETCKALALRRPRIPVILLTALKEDVDRIVGLELGADDYIGKPFNPRELVARIKAVLRRSPSSAAGPEPERIYEFAGFRLDAGQRQILDPAQAEVELTGAEFDLLRVFVERPGRLLSRDQLLDLTQGRERDTFDRSIDVLMSRLRRKLGERGADDLFRTVRNGGYQLVAPVQSQILIGRA